MKVVVTYIDEDALAPEEVVANAVRLYGKATTVSVGPDNSDPFNLIYFAVQELITARLLNSFYDDGPLYALRVQELRNEAITLATEAVTQVIIDTENKLAS